MDENSKISVGFSIPEHYRDCIRYISKISERSISDVVISAILKYIKKDSYNAFVIDNFIEIVEDKIEDEN